MATIDIKLSQSVINTNHALDIKYAQSPEDIQSLVDSIAQLDYQINSYYYYYSSYSASGNKLTIKFADGTTETLVGTLDNPYSYSGYATVTSQSISIPGLLNTSSSGSWRYYYNNYGSLSFQATSGTTTQASYKFLVNDVDFGQIGVSFEGAVSTNYSTKDFSGHLSKISMSATKYLSAATIEGDFNISGNSISIALDSTSASVSGTISGYNETYKDGSYIKVNGNGGSINYDASTEIGDKLLANPLNWSGNDSIKLDLPSTLYDNITISSGLGNDTILVKGGGNNVIVDAGAGNDSITSFIGGHYIAGGLGDDTYIVDNVSDVITENADEGTDLVQTSVSFSIASLANVENLTLTGSAAINATGNAGANTITGNAGANIIDGGTGNDILNGGAGNDVYIVSTPSDHSAAEIQDTSGTADIIRFTSTTDNDTLTIFTGDTGIEQVVISNTAGVTTGTNALNVDASLAANKLTITGNAGDNRITSSVFADTMIGGLGNDTYIINNPTDVITETAVAGSGIDTAIASVSYTLAANIENLTLTGASAINATGNASANTLTGNDAANILNGMAGADTMAGGLGDDTYIVDNVSDVITENADEGTDLVQTSVSFSIASLANVENLTLTGSAAINATGNAGANTITGNAGANIIDGGTGNDILNGGAGNDVIKGGEGSDILTGGIGNDLFVFDTSLNNPNIDTITDFKASGTDKIALSKSIFDQLISITPTANGVALNASDFLSGSSINETSNSGQHLLYNNTTGALYYDADGVGLNAAVEIALISSPTLPNVLSTDFLIII